MTWFDNTTLGVTYCILMLVIGVSSYLSARYLKQSVELYLDLLDDYRAIHAELKKLNKLLDGDANE